MTISSSFPGTRKEENLQKPTRYPLDMALQNMSICLSNTNADRCHPRRPGHISLALRLIVGHILLRAMRVSPRSPHAQPARNSHQWRCEDCQNGDVDGHIMCKTRRRLRSIHHGDSQNWKSQAALIARWRYMILLVPALGVCQLMWNRLSRGLDGESVLTL